MAREVAPGVWVQNLGWSNAVWIRCSDGWMLVDAGPRGSAWRLRRSPGAEAGCAPQRLLITHAHPDHAGGAAALQRQGCAVWGPELERAWLEHPERGGPPRPAAAELTWQQRWLTWLPLPVPPGVQLDRGLQAGERLDELRLGMSVINLAGHTPGQIGLWLERERVAIVADALMHLLPWLHPPMAAFTSDMPQAQRSVARLAALGPRVLVLGHGPPLVVAGDDDLVKPLRAAQARFAPARKRVAEPLMPPASRV